MNHRHLFEIAQTLDFEVRFKLVEPLDIIAFADKFHKIPRIVSGSDPAERIYSCKYRSFTKELTPQINANLWYMYSVVLSSMADEVRLSDVLYKWFTAFKLSNLKSNHLIMIKPYDLDYIVVFVDVYERGLSYLLFKHFKHRGYEYVEIDDKSPKGIIFTVQNL